MLDTKTYFDRAWDAVELATKEERENILKTSAMMGECMKENGVVQLCGIKHGLAFSMELGYRAGGLMPFHKCDPKDLALRGVVTEEELYDPSFYSKPETAHKLYNLYRIEKEDMFIIISPSGCEAMIVEMALIAKEKGHKVVAVLSKKLQDSLKAEHSSGKKLSEVADLVIDLHTDVPDAVLSVDEVHRMNQVQTVVGNTIAQMLTAETHRYLTEQGEDCPVLLSANVKGADVHNRSLSDKYLGRWNS